MWPAYVLAFGGCCVCLFVAFNDPTAFDLLEKFGSKCEVQWTIFGINYYDPPRGGALSNDAVWRLSVTYIGPKSRTDRPRKTKIGKEVAHVTRDLGTTSRSKGQGHRGVGHIVAAPHTACWWVLYIHYVHCGHPTCPIYPVFFFLKRSSILSRRPINPVISQF